MLYWKKREEETWGLRGGSISRLGGKGVCRMGEGEGEGLEGWWYISRTFSSPLAFRLPSVSPLS